MVEIIDGQEQIVMSLGGLKAASRGALLGLETAQVYQLRTDARKSNDAVKKGIASSIDTAKEESTRKLDKALKTLTDQENGELAKSESIPSPKAPKLKPGETQYGLDRVLYKEQKELVAQEKKRVQTENKELAERVKESLRNHPSFSAYIDKKYGSFEDVPTGKKGTIDYVSLAKDFMKSPFANVRSAPKSQGATKLSPESRKDKPKPKYSGIKDESSLGTSDYQKLNKGEPLLVFSRIPKAGGYAVNMILPPSDGGPNKIFTGVTAATRKRAASIYFAEQKEQSLPKSQRSAYTPPNKEATEDVRRTSRRVKSSLAVASNRRSVREQRLEQERNGQQALFPTSKPKSKSSYRSGDRVLY